MNTEGLTLAKVLENKELADFVTALGCGMGKNFDLARLRYGRVINELMGKDASARFRFIMERAEEAQELDV